MERELLQASVRDKNISAKSIRHQGFIPADFYGHGTENMSLQLEYQTFRKLYRRAGENTVIELNVPDKKKTVNVLVHNIDLDPITDRIIHVEFINVRMDEEVHTHIPLEFTGTAPAVKDLGGTFTAHYNEIEVKCLPKDLIHSIEVDISGLTDFTQAIHIQDLKVPAGITVMHDPELTVANVSAPRVEKEPEEVGAQATPAEGEAAKAEDDKKEEGGE